MKAKRELTAEEKAIINGLQGGFPISERPFRDAAHRLGMSEEALMERLGTLREDRTISRFGPLYNAERIGGAVTLAALAAPQERFDEIASIVNGHPEVAHNYARSHALNMWFVVACETPEQIPGILTEIEAETGCRVFDFPKREEFFIGFKVDV